MRNDYENVLVVDRTLLDRLGSFEGLTFDTAKYVPVLLDPSNNTFVPRHRAEDDPSLKQLIPYFIIHHADTIWCYVRGKASGEGRLVAKASIGIGGHINDQDEDLFGNLYETAALRELREEVTIPDGYTQRIVGLLNDDSNDVGKVHLGIVHVLTCPTDQVAGNEMAITSAAFKTVSEIQAMREQLETWSQICLDNIETLLQRDAQV